MMPRVSAICTCKASDVQVLRRVASSRYLNCVAVRGCAEAYVICISVDRLTTTLIPVSTERLGN